MLEDRIQSYKEIRLEEIDKVIEKNSKYRSTLTQIKTKIDKPGMIEPHSLLGLIYDLNNIVEDITYSKAVFDGVELAREVFNQVEDYRKE
ncbi:MAG: hypothetical protein ACOCRK_11010 [bacterium]